MKKNKPEIRFKGFEEEWIEKSLNDISSKVIDKNENRKYEIIFTNSAEQGIIDQKTYFDRTIANGNNIQGYYVVMPNDFVYNPRISTSAPVGPINRNKLSYTGVASPLYYVFRVKDGEMNLSYLDYFFKSPLWHNFMFLNGNSGDRSDRFSINDNVFVRLPIQHPESEEEQRKIGVLLTTLDKLIRKLELKLEKLRNIKQSLLKQMFTNVNGGYTTPLIRFKSYNGEWQMEQLGMIASKYSVSNRSIHHQNLLSLSYGKIKRRNINSVKGLLPASFDTYQIVKDGIIVLRFTDLQNDHKSLRVGLAKEEGIISPAYVCISVRDMVMPAFMYLQLHYYDDILKHFYKMGNGLRQTLSYSDIESMNVSIPKVSEQRDIVTFYDNLELCITKGETKLSKVRTMKQSLLQKMFA